MLNTKQHRIIMFNIIQDIFKSDIGQHLAFKGGTAAYFLYTLDRFSTDLDFDLLDSEQHIDDQIEKILQPYGTIKKGQKLILSYGEDDVNIKIDITRNTRNHNTYEVTNFYGTSIRVQDQATLCANKLVALTERHTNRDIYDVHFFLKKGFPVNEEVIQERTGNGLHPLLKRILEKLETLPQNYKILDGLGEVLNPDQKQYTKQYLIADLIGLIRMKLDFG